MSKSRLKRPDSNNRVSTEPGAVQLVPQPRGTQVLASSILPPLITPGPALIDFSYIHVLLLTRPFLELGFTYAVIVRLRVFCPIMLWRCGSWTLAVQRAKTSEKPASRIYTSVTGRLFFATASAAERVELMLRTWLWRLSSFVGAAWMRCLIRLSPGF